jgi:phosphatidylglycerophosphatase A
LGLLGLTFLPPKARTSSASAVPRDSVIEPSSPSERASDRENREASATSVRLRPLASVRLRPLALALATAGGAGYLPIAPGTWGSGVAVALCWAWAALGGGLALYVVFTVAVTAVGVWAADATERIHGRKDDNRIVIDEVAGQLLALAPAVLSVTVWARDDAFLPSLVTGFVLFRLFDIAKPGPVRWAERSFAGGLGVMADDVVAGLLAAAVLAAGLWAFGMFGGLA